MLADMIKPPQFTLQSESVCLLLAAFCLLFSNQSFWQRLVVAVGPLSSATFLLYSAVFLLLSALLVLLFVLVSTERFGKATWIVLLSCAGGAAYMMDHYGVIVDRHALQSLLESDARESMEWLSWSMLWAYTKLIIAPALVLIFCIRIEPRSWRSTLKRKTVAIGFCVLTAAAMISLNYQAMASIARNHTELRDLFAPFNVINATRAHFKKAGRTLPAVPTAVAPDAQRRTGAQDKPQLLVIVVGESMRASSFGQLGYDRQTTPELAKLPIWLFRHTSSCGTNTATSVPCMFSDLERKDFDEWEAKSRENLLDIYHRTGLSVQWIDNNTGSKDVARLLPELDVAHRSDTGLCNADGCHDEMLLTELDKYLPQVQRDSVLVLHMLGSHGPAYFERYPKRFAQFQPICTEVELQNCNPAALRNSYDNSVLYSDFVLSEIVRRVQAREQLNSAVVFISDHGESTGESGFYLHGAPYAIAPKEQTEVPMWLWFSAGFQTQHQLSESCLAQAMQKPTSHDAVFPMLLRLMAISTQAYRLEKDPLAACYGRAQ